MSEIHMTEQRELELERSTDTRGGPVSEEGDVRDPFFWRNLSQQQGPVVFIKEQKYICTCLSLKDYFFTFPKLLEKESIGCLL